MQHGHDRKHGGVWLYFPMRAADRAKCQTRLYGQNGSAEYDNVVSHDRNVQGS